MLSSCCNTLAVEHSCDPAAASCSYLANITAHINTTEITSCQVSMLPSAWCLLLLLLLPFLPSTCS
jgi:hypothetical protein